MAFVLTAPWVRLERPVAAVIVVFVGSGYEFGDYSAPLAHEVRRGGCWCAGGVAFGSSDGVRDARTGRHLCSACSCGWLRCAYTCRHLCSACSSDWLRCARNFCHLCNASFSVRVRGSCSCVRVHRTNTCCVFCCAQPTVTSCLHRTLRYYWRQP